MTSPISPLEIEIRAHLPALFRQLVESTDPLNMVREQISNIFAREVAAENVEITHYWHPRWGPSFVFRDNGCGMNYTGDLGHPGRLDRFIHFGFSRVAGFDVDEFSWKGLGSKLAYNCRRLEIETWTGEGDGYRVECTDPYGKLTQIPPVIPHPLLYQVPADSFDGKGTTIQVLGYNPSRPKKYSFEELSNFLRYRTAVGFTKPRELPKVVLKVDGDKHELETGFPFLKKDDVSDWRTVVLDPPIKIIQESGNSEAVNATLKGGFTLDTGKYGLSWARHNVGIILSVKGIPYFELDFRNVRGSFEPYRTLCCIVAECDRMEESLNIDRTWYKEDKVSEAFETAVRKALRDFTGRDEYKAYLDGREREKKKITGATLDARKTALVAPSQRFVYVDGLEGVIHREPENENDTLALLWKLEGMGKLPFMKFRTLEHTAIGGIDVIGEIQEKEGDEVNKFVAIEVEYICERFLLHRHSPSQTRYIFCWKIRHPDDFQPTGDSYKFKREISAKTLEVFEISKFPGLHVHTRR